MKSPRAASEQPSRPERRSRFGRGGARCGGRRYTRVRLTSKLRPLFGSVRSRLSKLAPCERSTHAGEFALQVKTAYRNLIADRQPILSRSGALSRKRRKKIVRSP